MAKVDENRLIAHCSSSDNSKQTIDFYSFYKTAPLGLQHGNVRSFHIYTAHQAEQAYSAPGGAGAAAAK